MPDERDPNIQKPEEDFSQMVKDYDLKNLNSNSPMEGRIIEITTDRVVIDIGQKTEGVLEKAELLDWDGTIKYKVGDPITVLPMSWNRREGYIVVSKKQVDIQEGWEKVVRAFKKDAPLTGRIIQLTPEENGFIVDMGVPMFLPMSQVDIVKTKSPKKLLGKEFLFKITKLNKKEMNGTLSRRVLLEEEKKEKVQKMLQILETGNIVKGVVTSVVEYGAFVDLGGIEGLVYKENISYGRINHPSEKLRKGDEIEVKVLEIDKERGKISLGIKQRFPDPWESIEVKFPVGKRLIAKVLKIVNFGAFIELEEGVEGLLHISDLTWEGRPNSVEEYVAVGDKLWVQVIEISKEAKKIKLGLKQLEMHPEEKYLQNHKTGEIVNGVVKKILKSRAFIGLEDGVEGVVKISDISYFRIDSPEEFLKEGEAIEAVIISDELDRNYKIQLGVKQLTESQWKTFFAKNKPGNIIPVIIKKVTDRGITVEITRTIEGFVRLSDADEEKLSPEEIMGKFKAGEKRDALIVRMEPEKKKIYLSLRAVNRIREREDLEKYMKSEEDTRTTVGDLLQNELNRKK